jgi:hypothetical protein
MQPFLAFSADNIANPVKSEIKPSTAENRFWGIFELPTTSKFTPGKRELNRVPCIQGCKNQMFRTEGLRFVQDFAWKKRPFGQLF